MSITSQRLEELNRLENVMRHENKLIDKKTGTYTKEYTELRNQIKSLENELHNEHAASNAVKSKKALNDSYGSTIDNLMQQYGISNGAMNKSGTIVNSSTAIANSTVANAKSTVEKTTETLKNTFLGNSETTNSTSTTSSTSSTSSNLLDEGLSAASSVGTSISNLWSSTKSTASEFASTIADKASGAMDYVSGLTDKAGGFINEYAGSALASATNMVNKLSNKATEATEWFNGITADFTNSDNNTETKTAFVASDNKDGVKNANLPAAELGIKFDKFTGNTFAKFKELAGPTNNLFTAISNAKKTVTGMVQSISKTGSAIVGSVSSTVKSVTAPISKTINTVKQLSDPNNVKASISSALDFLPFGLGDMVGKIAYNEAAKLHNKIGAVETRLNGIQGIGDKVQGLLSYANSPSEVTNDLGKIIIGLCSKDVSKKDLDTLFKAATEVCPNVATPSYMEFGNNKAVYTTLLKQAISFGSSTLISQLANCQKYFGTDTKKLITDSYLEAAKAGDPTVFNAMLDAAGVSGTKDVKKLAIALGTNLKQEVSGTKGVLDGVTTVSLLDATEDEGVDINEYYRSEYANTLEKLQITPQELISDDITPSAISASTITLLSRKPEVLNSIGITNDTRDTVLAMYNTYMGMETI